MQKLTKIFLEKLVPADGKQLIIRDSELPGFGVRLSGKTKSWIVEKRVVGVNRRITFGNYPAMACEEARQKRVKSWLISGRVLILHLLKRMSALPI
jgi:hypothetical protein